MNDDDMKRLDDLIMNRKAFRIGGRGICIECYPQDKYGWHVFVPRSFYDGYVDKIEVQGHVLHLSVEAGYVAAGQFDLYGYTKLTRLIYDI